MKPKNPALKAYGAGINLGPVRRLGGAMHHKFPQKVLFKHCDPAGIVFYPCFFEMINDAVEDMFANLLDWPFEEIVPKHGTPTASISVQFQ